MSPLESSNRPESIQLEKKIEKKHANSIASQVESCNDTAQAGTTTQTVCVIRGKVSLGQSCLTSLTLDYVLSVITLYSAAHSASKKAINRALKSTDFKLNFNFNDTMSRRGKWL